jgi:hypothetical protein
LTLTIFFLTTISAGPARAEVVESSDTGFVVKNVATVNASPTTVYSTLTMRIAFWWDPAHTFSGDARNLSLDPKPGGCFCERFPTGGGTQHLTVVFVSPGKELRLAGALGPLQQSGLSGSMIWKLMEAGANTSVELSYSVGGHRSGLREIAPVVDSVLRGQLTRLKNLLEGRPN